MIGFEFCCEDPSCIGATPVSSNWNDNSCHICDKRCYTCKQIGKSNKSYPGVLRNYEKSKRMRARSEKMGLTRDGRMKRADK